MVSTSTRSKNTRMEAPKRAGRKSVPHRVTMTKADNGGYSIEAQHKYADAKDEYGDRPMPVMHAFNSFDDAHAALTDIFGETHPDTKPASNQEGDEELPA